MFFGVRVRRVVLQRPHHAEDVLLAEHHLQQVVLVQQEDVLEYLVKGVQGLDVLQVFAGLEEVQEFLDVALALYGRGYFVSSRNIV